MQNALEQLLKRRKIYIEELAKLTVANEDELKYPQNLTAKRLEEILKAERYEERIVVCNFCIELLTNAKGQ